MNTVSTVSVSVPLIQTLPANQRGRDFVIGDLHGSKQLLDKLLACISFDPKVDRLFSTGDLIDRGEDSIACIDLLNKPWFYAVRGNHEAMLLDYIWDFIQFGSSINRTAKHDFLSLSNGGDWLHKIYDFGDGCPRDSIPKRLSTIRQLPLLMVIGEGEQRFHVVHAELYDAGKADEVLLDKDIDDLIQEWSSTDFFNIRPDDYPFFTKRWLWSRVLASKIELAAESIPEKLPSLSPSFCGHSTTFHINKMLSHINIDTGAVLAGKSDLGELVGGLSLVEVKEKKVYFYDGHGEPQVSIL